MKRLAWLVLLLPVSLSAQLKVANVFGDHMVLQRNKPIKVWGWNTANEKVEVQLGNETVSTKTNKDGTWELFLPERAASNSALVLKVKDTNEEVDFEDVLVGEVWLCSGQSNMEFKVRQVIDAEDEIAAANHPQIRHITIPRAVSFQPERDFEDQEWKICNSENVGDFTAVGYFFARKIQKELGVPVGLVHSSWGGSMVETWISKEALLNDVLLQDYAKNMPDNWEDNTKAMDKRLIHHFYGDESVDVEGIDESSYLRPDYDFSKWIDIWPIGSWDWKGVPAYRGTVYLEKDFEISNVDDDKPYRISFGEMSGDMAFYLNGRMVNRAYYTHKVEFEIAPGYLKEGKNSLLVQTSPNHTWGTPYVGLAGKVDSFYVDANPKRIPLMDTQWKARPSWLTPHYYTKWMNNDATLCYNAMIAPLVGLGMRGVLWYQGESNASRAKEYKHTFPLLIQDWRKQWKEDFPFLWVQLASYGPFNDSNSGSPWAELREAQHETLELPSTGEAVTIDIGNPKDIHPKNKQDVGMRLALSALSMTYGKPNVGSGPTYKDMKVESGQAYVYFENVGRGLIAKGKYAYLEGFEIAGKDQKFYFAKAEIMAGGIVKVYNENVPNPVAVRYAWSDSPIEANLYNLEDLPASPFRTDNWAMVTDLNSFINR